MSETIEYKGHTIRIEQDDNAQNPRKEWDNLSKMVCFHRGYDLGDKREFGSVGELNDFLKTHHDDIESLPLYLYDHSGLAIKTTPFDCPWDSGQVGIAYVSKEKIIENWPDCQDWREQARKLIVSEVEVYDQYLRGEVYGYIVEGAYCDDSCWGFYGDTKYMIDEAKAAIDYAVKDIPVQTEMALA